MCQIGSFVLLLLNVVNIGLILRNCYLQQVALENGLLLVDTKYEFGKGSDGTIFLIDEVGCPYHSVHYLF